MNFERGRLIYIYILALMLKPITREGISSNMNKKM